MSSSMCRNCFLASFLPFCFAEDTWITCKRGASDALVPVVQIVPGDEVVTHAGTRRVREVVTGRGIAAYRYGDCGASRTASASQSSRGKVLRRAPGRTGHSSFGGSARHPSRRSGGGAPLPPRRRAFRPRGRAGPGQRHLGRDAAQRRAALPLLRTRLTDPTPDGAAGERA